MVPILMSVIYLFQITNEVQLTVPTLKLEMFTDRYFPEMVLTFMSELVNIVTMIMTWKWLQHTNWNHFTYISQIL